MRIRCLNGNVIKIAAAVFMLADHIGFLLFPSQVWLRCIGRISMPLFAFLIAEGCRYTRNKFRRFVLVFLLGLGCQLVYSLFDPSQIYLNILLTFSFSIPMIYALQRFQRSLFSPDSNVWDQILSGGAFLVLVAFTYAVNGITELGGKDFAVDYGFWGCMLPVFAALPNAVRMNGAPSLRAGKSGERGIGVCRFFIFTAGVCLTCLHAQLTDIAWYALLAPALLLLYNGGKGKRKLKYFFYVFYPAHLVILEGIALLFD